MIVRVQEETEERSARLPSSSHHRTTGPSLRIPREKTQPWQTALFLSHQGIARSKPPTSSPAAGDNSRLSLSPVSLLSVPIVPLAVASAKIRELCIHCERERVWGNRLSYNRSVTITYNCVPLPNRPSCISGFHFSSRTLHLAPPHGETAIKT